MFKEHFEDFHFSLEILNCFFKFNKFPRKYLKKKQK